MPRVVPVEEDQSTRIALHPQGVRARDGSAIVESITESGPPSGGGPQVGPVGGDNESRPRLGGHRGAQGVQVLPPIVNRPRVYQADPTVGRKRRLGREPCERLRVV